jgi:hypothetical protein
LLLRVWIWPLAIVDSGANGGLKGDAGAVVGTGAGAGTATVLDDRLGSPRTVRRAGLGWRPSTVTCGISISAGAFGVADGPAAVAGAACDGAASGGACPAAGACAGAGASAGGAACGAVGVGVGVCANVAA